jgi:hypothetical protein
MCLLSEFHFIYNHRVSEKLNANSLNGKIRNYNKQITAFQSGNIRNKMNNKLNNYLKIAIKVSCCILSILVIALIGVMLSPALLSLAVFTLAVTLLLIGQALAVSSLIACKISSLVVSNNIKNYLESGSKIPNQRIELVKEKKALKIAIREAIENYSHPVRPPRRRVEEVYPKRVSKRKPRAEM